VKKNEKDENQDENQDEEMNERPRLTLSPSLPLSPHPSLPLLPEDKIMTHPRQFLLPPLISVSGNKVNAREILYKVYVREMMKRVRKKKMALESQYEVVEQKLPADEIRARREKIHFPKLTPSQIEEIRLGIYTPAERQEKVRRYRERRSRRNFSRGIMYKCRSQVAQKRPRIGGRFVKKNKLRRYKNCAIC